MTRIRCNNFIELKQFASPKARRETVTSWALSGRRCTTLIRVPQHTGRFNDTHSIAFNQKKSNGVVVRFPCSVAMGGRLHRWELTSLCNTCIVIGRHSERLTPLHVRDRAAKCAHGFAFARAPLTGLWVVKHVLEYW